MTCSGFDSTLASLFGTSAREASAERVIDGRSEPARAVNARARLDDGVAVLVEIAIGETHAGHRTAERDLVGLVDAEARLERNALQRSANRGRTDPDGVDRKVRQAHRAAATELDGACDRTVTHDASTAATAVEAGEGKIFAGDELAGFFGTQLAGRHRTKHGAQAQRHQKTTRQHATNSDSEDRVGALLAHDLVGKSVLTFFRTMRLTRSLPYQPRQHWRRLVGKF